MADMTKKQAPHADDIKTMGMIQDLVPYGVAAALEDAYHLGRLRGRMEGAEEAVKMMGKVAA